MDTQAAFNLLLQQAETRTKAYRAHPKYKASIPKLTHLTMKDYKHVYEPSEDTFLLLDAISHDFDKSIDNENDNGGEDDQKRQHDPKGETVTLEIGCGTGVATIHLASLLLEKHCLSPEHKQNHYVTDINSHAMDVTIRTAAANGLGSMLYSSEDTMPADCTETAHSESTNVDTTQKKTDEDTDAGKEPKHKLKAVQCDLATPFLSKLQHRVDILLFNPPYVPTPDDEVYQPKSDNSNDKATIQGGYGGINEASWAGGTNGRVVIDRALPQMATLLRKRNKMEGCNAVGGVAYMVVVDENDPYDIAERMMEEYGVEVVPWFRSRARNEALTVLKMKFS